MVVELPELVGLVFTFLLVVFLIALSVAYKTTLGLLLQQLAHLFRAINVHVPWVGDLGLGSVAKAIESVDNTIRHAIGAAIEANKAAFWKVLHFTGRTLAATGRILALLAHETEKALAILIRATVPALIASALAPLWLAVRALQLLTGGHSATLARIEARVQHELAHELAQLKREGIAARHAIATGAATAAAAVEGAVLPRLRAVERDTTRLDKWVREHASAITKATALGVVAAALAKLGLGWTRCSKVSRLGKAACGMDENYLASLIAGGLLVVGTIDLVRAAKDLQGLVAESATEVHRFWRV